MTKVPFPSNYLISIIPQSASQKDRFGRGKESWAFGTISRDHFYKVKKPKLPNPPCGAYNINYKQVDRKFKPLSWLQNKNESKVIKEKVEPDMRLIELKKDDNGFLDFKRFTQRNEFFRAQASNLNEKRFESFNYFTPVSTKTM